MRSAINLPNRKQSNRGAKMNIIDKHVTSLELSKRLDELGVSTPSNYEWAVHTKTHNYVIVWGGEMMGEGYKFIANAYLATELLEILPAEIIHNKETFYICIDKGDSRYSDEINNKYLVFYQNYGNELSTNSGKYQDTLPNAAADMLIYLIENNLIEVLK